MSKPPKIVVPGLNRGAGIPPGYIMGRRRNSGRGPAELLDLSQLNAMGVATIAQVTQTISVLSTAIGNIPPGFDGQDGEDGISIPGAPGAIGPQGPAGVGLDGQDGEDGLPGTIGPQGSIGATGPQGVAGPIGLTVPGLDGQDGEDGLPGAIGAPGPIGTAGPPGMPGLDGEDSSDVGLLGATGFVQKTGDTMTGPLTAPYFISNGSIVRALQLGPNSSISDITNGASTVYTDVSVGGAAAGAFIWRTTNAFNQLMILNGAGTLTASTFVSSGSVVRAFQLGPNSSIGDVTNGASTIYMDVSIGGVATGAFIWRTTNAFNQMMVLSGAGDLNVGASISVASNTIIDSNRTFRLRQYTVATLPTVGTAGRLAAVTDATAPTYLGTVLGGGAVNTPVYDNGTNWVGV